MMTPRFHAPLVLSLGLIALCILVPRQARGSYGTDLIWPTPNAAFLEGGEPASYFQPTASGRIVSADWGCTRNDGTRFHEGVDLKSIRQAINGRSLDPIASIASGAVAHVNRDLSKSNYGKYVVISHTDQGLEWYSLYAHLDEIDEAIRSGLRVTAGTRLGTMGNTSSNISIPVSNSHLHLEIGLRMNSRFEVWYATQGYQTQNWHTSWNGMNLLGVHPLEFFRYYLDHPGEPFYAYFLKEPVSFEVWVYFEERPDFLFRNPVFLRGTPAPMGPSWYRIGFTWYGMPVEWVPVEATTIDRRMNPESFYIQSLRHEKSCRKWIDDTPAGLVATPLLRNHLELLKTNLNY